jgi:hypothetical protein
MLKRKRPRRGKVPARFKRIKSLKRIELSIDQVEASVRAHPRVLKKDQREATLKFLNGLRGVIQAACIRGEEVPKLLRYIPFAAPPGD